MWKLELFYQKAYYHIVYLLTVQLEFKLYHYVLYGT
jgi:hypothetical protein